MPDRHGRFLGISVPALPWKREKYVDLDPDEDAPASRRDYVLLTNGKIVETSGPPRSERR